MSYNTPACPHANDPDRCRACDEERGPNPDLQRCGWCDKMLRDGQRAFLLDAGPWDSIDASIGSVGFGTYVCSKTCVREAVAAWWPGKG